jgi:hypothetical protein
MPRQQGGTNDIDCSGGEPPTDGCRRSPTSSNEATKVFSNEPPLGSAGGLAARPHERAGLGRQASTVGAETLRHCGQDGRTAVMGGSERIWTAAVSAARPGRRRGR